MHQVNWKDRTELTMTAEPKKRSQGILGFSMFYIQNILLVKHRLHIFRSLFSFPIFFFLQIGCCAICVTVFAWKNETHSSNMRSTKGMGSTWHAWQSSLNTSLIHHRRRLHCMRSHSSPVTQSTKTVSVFAPFSIIRFYCPCTGLTH